MTWSRFCALFSVACLVALSAVGCKPDYPECDTDEHCQDSEEGQESGNLYCVNNTCQQCRGDEDCGEGQECVGNACEDIPGWCSSTGDCPGDQVCRGNECGPECLDENDCEDGFTCEGGSCVEEQEEECSTDGDCGVNEVCERNECVEAPEPTCSLETVYFPFDSDNLTNTARNILEDNADCLQERDASLQVEGHADERGTTEYNLALGERRANAVRDFLTSLGVSGSDISTTSYGDQRLRRNCGEAGDESCHENNRRVEFNLR